MKEISLNKLVYNNFFYALGLITLSLGIFNVMGYSFSIANIIVLFLFISYCKKNSLIVFAIYFSLISYLLIIAAFFFVKLDLFEFIKSFLLTNIMFLVYLSSLAKPIYNSKLDFIKIISIIGIIIVAFECFQITEYLILGSSNSWFLLDRFSISTATDIGRFQAVNFLTFIRPISFYHEPSYLGIILLILLISANELKVNKLIIFIYYFGIILSFSTTALVFLVLYVIIKNFESFRKILFLGLLIMISLKYFLDKETLDTVFRFNEILNSGTSGNERLVGPFDYLVNEVFVNHHYFGIPLGQSNLVFNNSFYLLFLYFGVLTPLLLVIFSLYIIHKFRSNSFKYLIAFFSLLFLNGAIFTLESTLVLYCLNYSFVLGNTITQPIPLILKS